MHLIRFRILLIALGAIVSALTADGQAPTAEPAQATRFRVNTNLVLVDVVVTERDKAVHGLGRNQFHVFEDGHEQVISSFDERQPGASPAAAAKPAALPPHTYTNVPAYPESSAVNVLLLDGLNTLAGNQAEVRKQMLEYIGSIKPGTSIAIFTLSTHLRQLSGFTTDPAELTKVLKSRKADAHSSRLLDPDADYWETFEIDDYAHIDHVPRQVIADARQFQADNRAADTDQRVAMTAEALQDLARYLSGIPGRKNLIWFSGSFPVALDPDLTLDDPGRALRNYSGQLRETSNLLSAARVAVYPVDARGLTGLPSLDTSTMSTIGMRPQSTVAMGASDEQAIRERMPERSAMQEIAAATGGKDFNNTNGFEQAVSEAVEDGSSYYTLGYVPAGKHFDGQFRKLQVRVGGGKYQLAYRRGYYADPPDKPSAHVRGETSVLVSATMHGGPRATQITFQARVMPATEAAVEGAMPGHAKTSQRGIVTDFRVDPRGLTFNETPDGVHHGTIEFVLVAYDGGGKRTNFLDKLFYLDMQPSVFQQALDDGVTARLALDMPEGQSFLRLAVYDPNTERAGSLEVPLTVQAK